MPQRLSLPSEGELVDSWGRRNRKHADRACLKCGTNFRPKRAASKYCSRPCSWANNGKDQRPNPEVWWVNGKGYVEGRVVECGQVRRVRQHRWFMEKHLGHPLPPDQDVHHINGIKTDNRIENLEVITHGEHTKKHNAKATGDSQ